MTNLVNHNCRPGDVIAADWKVGRRNARVVDTFPWGVVVEINGEDTERFHATYENLTEHNAVFIAKLIIVGPNGNLLID